MKYVAGVDGGATRTRVAIADSRGRVLGAGESGPSNFGSVPPGKIKEHIADAFKKAILQAELSDRELDSVFLGIAGVISKADRTLILNIVDNITFLKIRKKEVDHDIRISLAGGLGMAHQEGIAFIVGTGSSCYGRTRSGHSWMSGGWGHILDDRGSAYDLACRGLSAVVRAEDGRGESTLLTQSMMNALDINNINQIMRHLYFEGGAGGTPMSKNEIASLAPLVINAAKEEDEIAIQIIDVGVKELALMVKAVRENLEFINDQVSVVTTGGMVEQSDYIRSKLSRRINEIVPDCRMQSAKLSPVLGGVILALQLAGTEINETIKETLGSYKSV